MKTKIASFICVDEQRNEVTIYEYADVVSIEGIGEVPFLANYITSNKESCVRLGDSTSFIVFKDSGRVVVRQKENT